MTPANDNLKVHIVGLGNLPWKVAEHFGRLNEREIITLSRPLVHLQELVIQSVEFMKKNSVEKRGAVYVIGDVYGRQCKVGKAGDPVSRLAQLQTGNPNQLFLHRVFWLKPDEADRVETKAHLIAEQYFERLYGEWFECGPHSAHEAIRAAIRRTSDIASYCVMTPSEAIMGVAA